MVIRKTITEVLRVGDAFAGDPVHHLAMQNQAGAGSGGGHQRYF